MQWIKIFNTLIFLKKMLKVLIENMLYNTFLIQSVLDNNFFLSKICWIIYILIGNLVDNIFSYRKCAG